MLSTKETEDATKKIHELEGKITHFSERLQQVEDSAAKSLFCYENIENKDDLVKFYTGFPDHPTLLAFYEEILESDAKVMRQWEGKESKDDNDEVKCSHISKLPLLEQFF